MKSVVLFSCLVAVALCAPAQDYDPSIRELPASRYEEVRDPYGQYSIRYITLEDTVVSEQGRLVPTPNGGYVLEISGQYQFVGDDGKIYVTRYRGGIDGFHVEGDHLPQPVAVPDVPAAA